MSPALKLFSQNDEYLLAECSVCGRVLKLKAGSYNASPGGFSLPSEVRCPCGAVASQVSNTPVAGKQGGPSSGRGGKVTCPRCGAEQVAATTQGFGLGKAAVGGLLLGPIGLLGGLFGRKNVNVACLKCGHRWAPSL